jgi:hypothetical protein
MNWLKTTTSAENPPFPGDFRAVTKLNILRISMETEHLEVTQSSRRVWHSSCIILGVS